MMLSNVKVFLMRAKNNKAKNELRVWFAIHFLFLVGPLIVSDDKKVKLQNPTLCKGILDVRNELGKKSERHFAVRLKEGINKK